MRNKKDMELELMKINLSVIVNILEMDLKNPPEEAVILIKKDLLRLKETWELPNFRNLGINSVK